MGGLMGGLALAACAAPAANGPIPPGRGEQTATIGDAGLAVFTFRPAGCTPTAILLVFHGVDRNPDRYRDDAIPVAERGCLLVVAPLFPEALYPGWRYQQGGIVHRGALQPAASWTVRLVPLLADWARARVGMPALPYALLGHSAGAQFVSRVAAYALGAATQFVIANPSTWVRPLLDVPAPFGFGPPFPPDQAEADLRRMLALPVTVLLGAEDTGSKNLSETAQAEAQGRTRVERGQTVFHEAEATARAHGWPFGWRLSIVPGTGHNARAMLAAPGAFAALAPR